MQCFLLILPEVYHKSITAESGQSITLPCRAPNDNIKFVHWSRADLEPEYLLVYQDGQILPDKQHPSLKNLMDLQDGQMKDGDVSLILKDVTTADDGTYQCRVFMEETRSWKLSMIDLIVPPGESLEFIVSMIRGEAASWLLMILWMACWMLMWTDVYQPLYVKGRLLDNCQQSSP
uniref:Ig-like domain-containing protein n=1 Tax=Amphilophus citrinellus TaxID=61819 RepID=A0A3Q0SVV6_AMPCI